MQGLEGTKALLRRIWSPVVMVVASPEAEDLCHGATGLAVAELLRPFGVLHELNDGLGGMQTWGTVLIGVNHCDVLPNAPPPPPPDAVPVRTVAEQSLRLHQWLLRFHAGSAMFQPERQAADAYLSGLLTRAATAAAAGDVPTVEHLVATADTEDATPWHTQYREAYLRMLAFGAHETMDHPVACERWFLGPLLQRRFYFIDPGVLTRSCPTDCRPAGAAIHF
jgi:hypothetical protein